ncbi:MAG TPA: DegV family protein [Lachnospiraceae bacterium]|uniref:DegV family protein n=1 Tax=Anaerosporobacter sp. TaxID=1872529 RepID=UPI000ED679F5|nr:DegV family protein [Anaerosporobacter sp.]HAB59376.1 DegV family protein [Lachnospiraceae bacterium]
MKYQIISDGSCDLSLEYAKEKGLEIVPFYVSFDGENYYKAGVEVNHFDFYNRMIKEHVYPKTSLPSVQDFIDVFSKYAETATPMICICITTKFSGSYQSACNAKDLVLEKYPDAVITVIDSMVNTVLQGLYVQEALRMQKDGVGYEEAIAHLERIKSTGRIIFTIGSMDYLKKGGRMGKLLTFASDTLGIKPLIVLKEGEIFPAGITRSREKSKKRLIDIAQEHFKKIGEDPGTYSFAVGTGIDFDEAEKFKDMVDEGLGVKVPMIGRIGVTIGTHTGPHPIGMGFIKRYDA